MASPAEIQAMRRALELARAGGLSAFPNPLVGAVIFDSSGNIDGEGYHEICGGPHAEVLALEKASDAAFRGTLVVTLEPCCHYGRTSPCTDAILSAGIARVVVAMEDPDPRVAGRGIQTLRDGGIQVETGVLREEALRVNSTYLHFRETGRSWLRLKLALSMDGRLAAADGGAEWITCPTSREAVHRMRAESAAVLTGAGTVRSDDPRLTVRLSEAGPTGQPVRIILSMSGDMGGSERIFSGDARTIVVVPEGTPTEIIAPIKNLGAEIWELPGASDRVGIDLHTLLRRTAEEGMGEVLAECGSGLSTALLRERLVNSMAVFTAPLLLGAGGFPAVGDLSIPSMDSAIRLQDVRASISGSDTLLEGSVVYGSD